MPASMSSARADALAEREAASLTSWRRSGRARARARRRPTRRGGRATAKNARRARRGLEVVGLRVSSTSRGRAAAARGSRRRCRRGRARRASLGAQQRLRPALERRVVLVVAAAVDDERTAPRRRRRRLATSQPAARGGLAQLVGQRRRRRSRRARRPPASGGSGSGGRCGRRRGTRTSPRPVLRPCSADGDHARGQRRGPPARLAERLLVERLRDLEADVDPDEVHQLERAHPEAAAEAADAVDLSRRSRGAPARSRSASSRTAGCSG